MGSAKALLTCVVSLVGCAAEPGPAGEMGEMGEMGAMGSQGQQGIPGMGAFDPAVAIANGLAAQPANFNVTGLGLIGNAARVGAVGADPMPQTTLEVNSLTNSQVSIATANSAANQFSYLFFDRSRGTLTARADVLNGDEMFRIYARGFKGGELRDAAIISGIVDGAPGATTVPGALSFQTHNGAAFGERMRITSAGRVGIGTSAPNGQLTVGTPLSGSVLSTTLNTNVGSLSNTAGSELSLATFGFQSGNNSFLGIRARRVTGTASWQGTSIGIGMDVDNTVRAGASVWLHHNGNVGIVQSEPAARLDVNGGIKTQWSGSTVVTLAASNVITHNLNATNGGLVFVTNGDPPANGAIIIGAKPLNANQFEVWTSGGGQGALVRFNWVILAN